MILIGARDAGPANYLARIAVGLKSEHYTCFHGPVSCHTFREFNIQSESYTNFSDVSPEETTLVISGTTLDNSFDRDMIRWAKDHQIPSVSVVEHWTHFSGRFEAGHIDILPDYIFVNDEYAYQGAIEAGLPESRLKVVGNPTLESIEVVSGIANEQHDFVFISEELSVHGPDDGPRLFGFNEYDVLDKLVSFLPANRKLFIKSHPAENMRRYDEYLAHDNVQLLTGVDKAELGTLGGIIGMGSFLLIELALMGFRVHSFRPNSNTAFIGNELGLVYDLNTSELKDLLESGKTHETSGKGIQFKESTERILSFINQYI